MAFVKREIKDRVVQYPRRYQLVEVQPGIFDLIPVTGTVTEEGTPVNKELLQRYEDGISDLEDGISDLEADVVAHLADDVQHGKIGTKEVDESEIGDEATLIYSAELGKWVVKMRPLDDLSGSPGSPYLISGTMEEGFFGEVPASELFTASGIASVCGISQGTAQFENEPWLKFALDGKILFRPRKAIRHSISWDSINAANCVYGGSGGKRVTKNGQTYIVRLMKGALTDPSLYDTSDRGAKGSEWNRLMLPIHEQAIDKSWAYPNYVEENVPVWSHNLGTGANGMYTDSDLRVGSGDGRRVWCQETSNTDATRRVDRGSTGVSISNAVAASNATSGNGWSPVLEFVS